MKKVFLSLAVIFSVALVSCGGHKAEEQAQEAEENQVEAPVVEEVAAVTTYETINAGTDSQRIDTIVAVAGQEVQAAPQPEAGN